MALTIAIEGKGVILNCDLLIDDTGGTGTADWLELGGGSIDDASDSFLFGTTAIANQYASKSGWTYADLGVGNELDFSGGGTEEGQFIYIWLNILAPGPFDTVGNEGFAIRIGSSTTVYRNYVIAGDDDSNGWSAGWKLFVLDPTRQPTSSAGTQDLSSIRMVGIWIDTNNAVRADSIFIDQIAIGTGLRITGTSTNGWEEVVDYCTDFTNRAWGMMQERDGIYYAFGKFFIGDEANQAANVSFADAGRVIQFGTTQYYTLSGVWESTMPSDAAGIVIEDHSSYSTTFTDGILVGSDNGRSGSVFLGNSDQDILLDLHGGNHADSATILYGTTFKALAGPINSGDDDGHKFFGVSFIQCSQFDPVGAPEIRNCVFSETVDIDAACLWNSSIDIQDSSFIANETGAGMEHPAQGTFNYVGLTFAGNTNDLLYSAPTNSGILTINKDIDSVVSTYEIANPTGNSVSILLAVTVAITARDSAGVVVEGARVLLEAAAGGDLPANASVTSIERTDTTATAIHTAHGLSTGWEVSIGGATQEEYNGIKTITVVDVDTYTFSVSGSPTTPAEGTLTSTAVILSGLTNASGIIQDTGFNFGTDQPIIGKVRKGTATPYYKTAPISGSITSAGFTSSIFLVSDE